MAFSSFKRKTFKKIVDQKYFVFVFAFFFIIKIPFSTFFKLKKEIFSKDVRLPLQLQRAMAAEAEAAREARAKVRRKTI